MSTSTEIYYTLCCTNCKYYTIKGNETMDIMYRDMEYCESHNININVTASTSVCKLFEFDYFSSYYIDKDTLLAMIDRLYLREIGEM